MAAERNAFKLGLTMIVFFAVLASVLWFLAPTSGGDLPLRVRYPHDQFSTALKPGGQVTCGGNNVGSIQAVVLEEMIDPRTDDENLFVVVHFTVQSSIGLREDATITPMTLLLGGPGKLAIDDRGVGEPVEPGDLLEGASTTGINDLAKMIAEQLDERDPSSLMALIKSQLDAADPSTLLGKILMSLDDVNSITAKLAAEFEPQEQDALLAKLHEILTNVNDMTSRLRAETDSGQQAALTGKIHAMMDQLNQGVGVAVGMIKENREPINQTVLHVRDTSKTLEERIAARIADQLNVNAPASLLAKVHVAVDGLDRSIQDINVVTRETREVIVLNHDRLDEIIENFKEVSDQLKNASREIRRSPWRLFYQPRIEEAAQANVFDAARSFSAAATQLDDAVARIESIVETGDLQQTLDDDELMEIRTALQHTFEQFSKAEAALWQQLDIK